ncbi:lanthionine synthetase LanC family protein [Nonomuraea sp. NPDC050540]|uniref:lanthionine synthetase LanC family protein n=1 Tax=Nonomuraea sp. NPDC050540 TaxID=3364367 RepID=UPI0037AECC6E
MTTSLTTHKATAKLVGWIADQLHTPNDVWRQSLAFGAPGIALLHLELAAAELRPWQRAHDWLTFAASGPLTTGRDCHLFYGAPAMAHVLACADTVRPGVYADALALLDRAVAAEALRCAALACSRADRGEVAAVREFDTLRGLAGLGSHLLRRDPQGEAIRQVLAALVRVSQPFIIDGEQRPGWWALEGPREKLDPHGFPGGHANLGMAHGIGGPLALLALAARQGVTVDGQLDAIGRITAVLDRWQCDTGGGLAWPYWITVADHRAGSRDDTEPQRLAWCYGTAGLARAQQLAALATGDPARRSMAESALADALTTPGRLAATDGPTLCHGFTGLALLALRAAEDAEPASAERLQAALPALLEATAAAGLDNPRQAPALLEGAAGIALAAHAAATGRPPRTEWDTCLLIA